MKNHFCTIDSIAHILNCTRDDFLSMVGHDGSRVIFPEFEYPKNVRGFSPDELITGIVKHGAIPIMLPMFEAIIPEADYPKPYQLPKGFNAKTCPVPFVAFLSKEDGLNHAVAVLPKFQIFDPAGNLTNSFGPYSLDFVILVLRSYDDVATLSRYWHP